MHGAEHADDDGEYPEHEVLRISDADIGDHRAAHVEQRVKEHAQPDILRFIERNGEHRADQKGVSDLQKVTPTPAPEKRLTRCHNPKIAEETSTERRCPCLMFASFFWKKSCMIPRNKSSSILPIAAHCKKKEGKQIGARHLCGMRNERRKGEVHDRDQKTGNTPCERARERPFRKAQ